MRTKTWIAVIVISAIARTTLQAAGPILPEAATPHPLRDAIARQHQPLAAAPSHGRAASPRFRRHSTATKVTAGVALGLVGMYAGMLVAFGVANAAHTRGDGRRQELTGAIIGGGAGAALGVWLASR